MPIPIPIRRFRCCACARTFSWRPVFLVFGCRYVATAYQREFKAWALGRDRQRKSMPWYELGQAASDAFRQRLGDGLMALRQRLRTALVGESVPGPQTENVPSQKSRLQLWHLARRAAQHLNEKRPDQPPRLSCYLLCLALARLRGHRGRYHLESAA